MNYSIEMIPAILILLAAFSDARGAMPLQPSLRDYVHTSWTEHDGVPLSAVESIAQTTDGYLWIETIEEGLLRFDGVRFVSIPPPCARPARIADLQSDGVGGLWLFCSRELYHLDSSGRSTAIKIPSLSTRMPTASLFLDRRRRLWLWARSLTYVRSDGSQGPEIPGTERPSDSMFGHFAEDAEGSLWFATNHVLLRVRDDRAERVLTGTFLSVARASSGGIYVLQSNSLLHLRGNSISTVATFDADLVPMAESILEDTNGGIWFGTRNRGLALIRDGKIQTFGAEEGLGSGLVETLYADREGTIWAGTPFGLHRFREPLAYLMSAADGVPPGLPRFVFQDSRYGLWVGTELRTVRIDRNQGRTERLDFRFNSIGEDKTGRIWTAKETDLGYLDGRRFVPVRDSRGEALTGIYSLRADNQGDMWALSDEGLYRVTAGKPHLESPPMHSTRFLVSKQFGLWLNLGTRLLQRLDGRETVFDRQSLLTEGSVYAIYEDGASMWIGGEKGLFRRRNGKWTTWTLDQGLPGRGSVFEITTDTQGRLWLMSDGGILVLNRAQLDETPDGAPRRLAYLRIGTLDRVLPHRGGIVFSPRIARGRDERLFFVTNDSIAVVNPANLNEQSFTPPIVLENVLVNRRPVLSGVTRFVEPEDVQFEYTSLSLRSPENVRFRYLLEGYDKDWIDAGVQRRATYSSLKPGSYRFRIIGSGSEGVWNNTGASYAFQIAAPFYKTPLFLLAFASVLVAIGWLIVRYRVQLAGERIRLRLEARDAERLRIAQEMHDSFLQGIQGSAFMVYAAMEKMDEHPSESRILLDRALKIVAESTDEARRMLSSLRATSRASSPPAEPFIARLESLVRQELVLHSDPPRVTVEATTPPRELQPDTAEDAYLIAAEALRNALRHSKSQSIQIGVQFSPAEFELIVADDGLGIAAEICERGREGHFGLQGMRERAKRHAGVLTIISGEEQGTQLCLVLPANNAYRQDNLR